VFGVITAKRNMERILSRGKTQQPGCQKANRDYQERIATDADSMWRVGLMGLHGIFVPKLNIDKESRN
jgi:hypothetical protein